MPFAIVERTRELAAPLAGSMGFEVVDVGYARNGAEWYLTVYIDKRGGIRIDDCERFSNLLSPALDGEDVFNAAYNLVVSSPGLDRPLKTDADFRRYAGELLDIVFLPGKMKTGVREEPPEDTGGPETGARSGKTKKSKYESSGPDRLSGILNKIEDGRVYLYDNLGGAFSVAWEDVKTAKRAVRFN